MSRFVNLELGGESEDQTPAQKPLVKDQAYYQAEAKTAFENGEFEQALRFYAKVLEFNPNDASAWTGQVRMLIELGQFREARLWADKALERFAHEPELLAAKAVALARSGDAQGALAFSDSAIEERGDTPYVWLARADVLLASKETRADFCFEKARLLAPRDWFVAWLAARGHSSRPSPLTGLAAQRPEHDCRGGAVQGWLIGGVVLHVIMINGLALKQCQRVRLGNRHALEGLEDALIHRPIH